jgi:hypothetical protein
VNERLSALAFFGKFVNKTVVLCLILTCLISLYLAARDSAAEETSQEEAIVKEVIVILDDVVGLNVADGNIRKTSVSFNSSLSERYSGLAQEEVDIRFTYGLRATVEFINNTLHEIYLAEEDGPSFGGVKAFLGRIQTYTGDPFYGELSSMLDNVTGENLKIIVGNVELEVHNSGPITDYMWTFIDENGIRAPTKNVILSYERGGF